MTQMTSMTGQILCNASPGDLLSECLGYCRKIRNRHVARQLFVRLYDVLMEVALAENDLEELVGWQLRQDAGWGHDGW